LVQFLTVQRPHRRTGLERAGCQFIEELQQVGTALTLGGGTDTTPVFLRPLGKEILHNFGQLFGSPAEKDRPRQEW
jgi:hypothetical protein